jgi:hypothetical protein
MENNITCKLFSEKLKMMCKLSAITYFEEDFEIIKKSMMGLLVHAKKGYIGIDMPSLYRIDSFNKIGEIDDKLVIRDENDDTITDILIKPKKMIVHIDEDIRKNYIMLMSNNGIKYNKGRDTIFFEHISDLEELLDINENAAENSKKHDTVNIYRDNYPILVHPLNSAYEKDDEKKEMLFLAHSLK